MISSMVVQFYHCYCTRYAFASSLIPYLSGKKDAIEIIFEKSDTTKCPAPNTSEETVEHE